MGMAAISAMSWPPMRTARLSFFKREPPHSGHGTLALSLIRLPRSAISPRPLQRGQAPSGLLNENRPGVISGAEAPQLETKELLAETRFRVRHPRHFPRESEP